jgi:enoyl-CoA hydratase/carnithine racemase
MTEVRTERIGGTLLITIDRPQARNAVNAAVAAGLAAALEWVAANPDEARARARRARERSERYSWRSNRERYVELLGAATGRGS